VEEMHGTPSMAATVQQSWQNRQTDRQTYIQKQMDSIIT